MALHKTGTPASLKEFVKQGKIILVLDGLENKYTNLGAVVDLEVDGDKIAWIASTREKIDADRFKEIRIADGDGIRYEVELLNNDPLTLVFRDPMNPSEVNEIKNWSVHRDKDFKDRVKHDMPLALKDISKITLARQRDKKYYFSFWTRYIPNLGLYPIGIVLATGSMIRFIATPGYEVEADFWTRDFANEVTGNPFKDLEKITRTGGQTTSFSVPQPIAASDSQDAADQALGKAIKSQSLFNRALRYDLVIA